jgi:hypothetical protein
MLGQAQELCKERQEARPSFLKSIPRICIIKRKCAPKGSGINALLGLVIERQTQT